MVASINVYGSVQRGNKNMKRRNRKRILCVGLSVFLVFSTVPVKTMAAENQLEIETEYESESQAHVDESEPLSTGNETTLETDVENRSEEELETEAEPETETEVENTTEMEVETETETETETEAETEAETTTEMEAEAETEITKEVQIEKEIETGTQSEDTQGEKVSVGEPPVPAHGDNAETVGLWSRTARSFRSVSGVNTTYHTPDEITEYLRSSGASLNDKVTYATKPVTSGCYYPGSLSDSTLNSSLAMLNQVRFIAGLESVSLNTEYNELCQTGALVNYVNKQLTHFPSQPSDMSDELYQKGYEGCSSSNIAWCSSSAYTLNSSILKLWMGDSDSSNIDRLGHRRWLLNPVMQETGFGAVSGSNGIYSAVYAFDNFSSSTSVTGVAWPARVMPIGYFSPEDAWSFSVGSSVEKSTVQVRITRRRDERTWSFSSAGADGYFNVDNGGYGQPGCIIFRPQNIGSYSEGDVFDVNVAYGEGQQVDYSVAFFTIGKQYSITYNLDGGLNSCDNPLKYYAASDTIILQPATREGYEFEGWYKDSAFMTEVTQIPTGSQGNITLYARWKMISSGECGSELTWELNDDGLLRISGNGLMTDFSDILATPWCYHKNKITRIALEEGVSSIGNQAFAGCCNLSDVQVPDSLVSVGAGAFRDCDTLTTICLPESIGFIGDGAFAGSNSITIYCYNDYVENYAEGHIIPCKRLTLYYTSDPVFSIVDGSQIEANTRLSITTSTNGARIYYTIDGMEPTQETGILYEDAIVIESAVTVKAIAVKDKYRNSNMVSASYTVIDESENWGDISDEDKSEMGFTTTADIPTGIWVSGVPTEHPYTGKSITFPGIRVYYYKTLLTLKRDYRIGYSNNTKVGIATITITGQGNYANRVTTNFNITPLDIANAEALDILLAYNGKVQKKAVQVKYELDGKTQTLKQGTDYILNYPKTNPKEADYDARAFREAGDYYIEIIGKGNYSGNLTVKETITGRKLISIAKVAKITNQKYTGAPIIIGNKLKLTQGNVTLSGIEENEYRALSETARIAYDYTYSYSDNLEIGTAFIRIKGVNEYAGDRTVSFKIIGNEIKNALFHKTLTESYTWTGSAIEPVIGITDDIRSAALTYKINKEIIPLKGILRSSYEALTQEQTGIYDYVYEYMGDTTNVGTVKINITGVNGYTGTVSKCYKITGIPMNKLNVTGYKTSYSYTGQAIKPGGEEDSAIVPDGFKVYIKATKSTPEIQLTKGEDYTISYQNNIKAGTAMIIITGINGYTGTIKKSFRITAYNIAEDAQNRISVKEIGDVIYTKGNTRPIVTVRDSNTGEILESGKDYNVSYKNNSKVNDASAKNAPAVIIKGKGSYSGTVTKTFTIINSSLTYTTMTATDIVYQNKSNLCKPKIALTDTNGVKLVGGIDYDKAITYTYARDIQVQIAQKVNGKTVYRQEIRVEGDLVMAADIIPVGAEIKATVRGKGYYANTTKDVVFRCVKADLARATASVSPQVYTGKAIEPTKEDIEIRIGKNILSKSDYEIVSYHNNVSKSTATITVRGCGNYGGTKNIQFKIIGRPLKWWFW